jgi:hypothetical protein
MMIDFYLNGLLITSYIGCLKFHYIQFAILIWLHWNHLYAEYFIFKLINALLWMN